VRPARIAIAVILVLLGAVWLGQGLGVLPGGFMRGSLFWGVLGGVLVAVGAALLAVERRRTR
jgi:hypothetical protein